jgi:pyruvate formate lyase activating enzyme
MNLHYDDEKHKALEGSITGIQDYAVHDGYGLRTLVFLKGCPLRCRWCQNPESLTGYPEIAFHPSLCVQCGHCKEACLEGAISDTEEKRIDRERCTRCMACVKACRGGALSQTGLRMTAEQLVRKLCRYAPFYTSSDRGGVTISGGEPLYQVEFTAELLRQCRENTLHTAIETSGYADYDHLRKIVGKADLLLYDIKHMDDSQHKAGTGIGNREILANLTKLCAESSNLEKVVRIPLIPGYNDSEENVGETAQFVRSLGIGQIDLLAFNELPSEKYKSLGKGVWEYANAKRQPKAELQKLANAVAKQGLRVTIGGLW